MSQLLNRRDFSGIFATVAGALALPHGLRRFVHAAESASATDRPNILWIIGEDMGPDLGCYGTPQVRTPNLDKLASEGARFVNAFTTAPVCSPSRSALITGMYQTSIGAHNHRSHRKDGYALPEGVKLITDYFRAHGYFTANVKTVAPGIRGSGKTDFNFTVKKPFDGDDWNQRRPGQPFYAQVNFTEPHRGRTWPAARKTLKHLADPAKVVLPPYYPDHPVVCDDFANYLDAISALDVKVGAVLKRLEEERLADNTIALFFGDNGRCHIRGKQWLYDAGIHVPLIVRWPGKIKPGTVRTDLVSGIDISATSLRLAGIETPKNMQGQLFLGPEATERKYIFAARDRCDETVDWIRCVRTKQHKYIRNYHPDRPYTQSNEYIETNYPTLAVLKELHAEGKLTAAQKLFMQSRKPAEELYDVLADPHEVNNLADSPAHQAVLKQLREAFDRWITETGDMGAIPEENPEF